MANELIDIQCELKAPKNQYNSFGKYSYRSCEDILEALKPILKKYGCLLYISDEIEVHGDRYYVKATATFVNSEGTKIVAYGLAREPENQKGNSEAQVTGATSSYARKYALNGLFCIDDTKDADTMDNRDSGKSVAHSEPKKTVETKQKFTTEQIEIMKSWKDGTFSEEELADFKRRTSVAGANLNQIFQWFANEYDKRKEKGVTEQDEKGADAAFENGLF